MKDNKIKWDEGDKADHFRLSDLYDLVAFELNNQAPTVIDVY